MNSETKLFIILSLIFIIGFSVIVVLSTNAENQRLEAKYQEAASKIEKIEKINITAFFSASDEQILSDSEYVSENEDEVTILATEGGIITAANLTVNKKGNASKKETAETHGINSALLANKASQITISDSKIITDGEGANAIFSNEENSIIYVSGSEINTNQKNSHGLVVNNSGKINAEDITISVMEEGSYGAFVNSKNSNISISNSEITNKGKKAPLMYVRGNLVAKNIEGDSNSVIAVIEENGNLSLEASKITTFAEGISDNNFDNAGISILNKKEFKEHSTLTLLETTIEIDSDSDNYKTSPMFLVTNASADINITESKFKFGSNLLLKILGNNNEWGKSGANGGDVILNVTEQSLEGNIQVDENSMLSFNLIDSEYKGAINPENEAKEINVNIDAESKVSLTDDWYITTLNVEDESLKNIEANGYTIYYDTENSANDWLKDGINLLNGGRIAPME